MNAGKPLTRRTPLGRGKPKARPVDVTHAHLVAAGARWLMEGTAVCAPHACIVVTEQRASWGASGESPDIIAWNHQGESTVVEVKVSRGDFLADSGKAWRRRGGVALGRTRWYLAPAGMIEEHELPPGWGLLEYHGEREAARRIAWAIRATPFSPEQVDTHGETLGLIQACRRLGVRSTGGVACRAYTMQTQCQTEVLVAGETEGESNG